MNSKIQKLIEKQLVWKATEGTKKKEKKIPSGFLNLDEAIGGWPSSNVIELIHKEEGIGEISILTPLMARLSKTTNSWIVLVNPPYIPYAPSITARDINLSKILVIQSNHHCEMLWAMEQALSAQDCSIVIGWPKQINERTIRKFKAAARQGETIGFYIIDPKQSLVNSSVSHKILVEKKSLDIQISILKNHTNKQIKPFLIKDALAMSQIKSLTYRSFCKTH